VRPSSFLFRFFRKAVIPNLPARWRLPVQFWSHTRLATLEPEMRYLDLLSKKRTTAIDVGANIGLYSFAFSRLFKKVHAFEINPFHSRDLVAYGAKNVEIHQMGLSNRSGDAVLYTPIHPTGLRLESWASLDPSNCPEACRLEECQVQVGRLDDFGFQECSFLKIDVEGHEVEVLQGAIETIARTRPRILIEVRGKNLATVDSLLADNGLKRIDIRTLLGRPGADGNYFYIP
jgi:FkbM family methyltransferase